MHLCQKIPAADILWSQGWRGGQKPHLQHSDNDKVCACPDQGCPHPDKENGNVKDSEELTQLLPSRVWCLQSCVLLQPCGWVYFKISSLKGAQTCYRYPALAYWREEK